MAIVASAAPPVVKSRRWGESARKRVARLATGERRPREPDWKPVATSASSSAAKSGRGSGRSSASALEMSSYSLERSIACLPQLDHGSVQLGAGIRLAGAEHTGDLFIGEPGEELEGDQLTLARLELTQSSSEDEAQLASLVFHSAHDARGVDRLGAALGMTATAAQLVKGGVAGDAEEPCSSAALARVEAGALAVGALEGRRGCVLGRRAIAKQAGRVGEDVVSARLVETLEVDCCAQGARDGGCDSGLAHVPTTGELRIHHTARYVGRSQAAWASCAEAVLAQAARIDSRVISSRRRRSDSEIERGGMRTTTSESGRMIAPCSRASSVTRWPMRRLGSWTPRSMPAMKPRPRTSATSGIASISASAS